MVCGRCNVPAADTTLPVTESGTADTVKVDHLAGFEVAPDGSAVRLEYVCQTGASQKLELPLECFQSLALADVERMRARLNGNWRRRAPVALAIALASAAAAGGSDAPLPRD